MIGEVLRGANGQLHIEETGVSLRRKGFAGMTGLGLWGAEKVVPYESIVGLEFRSAIFAGSRLGFLQLVIHGGPEKKSHGFTDRRELLADENTIAWQRSKKNGEFEAARDFILSRIGGTADAVKTCPDCAEHVKAAANVCRFCGHRFDTAAPS
jgi:Uncharacterised protein family UPF0547